MSTEREQCIELMGGKEGEYIALAEYVANRAYDEDFADKVWDRFEDMLLEWV
jgi:hypothetical protein